MTDEPNVSAPAPADAALLRGPVKPADAALLYDIANAAMDDAAARGPDGAMRVVAFSAHAAARLRALAEREEGWEQQRDEVQQRLDAASIVLDAFEKSIAQVEAQARTTREMGLVAMAQGYLTRLREFIPVVPQRGDR